MIREAVLRALQQARHMAPPAGIVLVASLAAPLAEGAPGDLDPTFGDAGRLELPDFGRVWSLELEDDGDGFLAGGDYFCYYDDCSLTSFTHPFSSSGALDLDYTPPELPNTLVLDTARQPDGKLVGIGRTTGQTGLDADRVPPATRRSAGRDVRRGWSRPVHLQRERAAHRDGRCPGTGWPDRRRRIPRRRLAGAAAARGRCPRRGIR